MKQNGENSIELEINSNLESISSLEPELASIVSPYFSDASKSYFVVLSVIEILCNIIEHGYGGNPNVDDVIKLNVTNSEGEVAVRLMDSSAELPRDTVVHLTSGKTEMPSIDESVENLPESGWGLNIVTHTASKITYQRLNNTNILTLGFESDCGLHGVA